MTLPLPPAPLTKEWAEQNNRAIEQWQRQIAQQLQNAAAGSALGLGTAATQNTGTSGATLPFCNTSNTWALSQVFTSAPVFGDPSGSRNALGLGTAAVQNTGTSGGTVPLCNTANTWSLAQTFAVAGMSSSVKLAQVSDATTYGVVSLNGTVTAAGAIGLIGGGAGDANLYLRAATGGQFDFRVNGVQIGSWSASGLATSGLSITQGAVISGTYTPTLTGVTNVAATTSAVCQYMRVGSVVTVSGRVNIDPTAASAITSIRISLPVASNFAATGQCSGSGMGDLNLEPVGVYGDAANNEARLDFVPLNNANQIVGFHFTYLVV
jgi:hypothetical protein